MPFLYQIHGHPDDFHRGTASWWSRLLNELGFEKIIITPLLWGPISTSMSVAGIPGPFRRQRMKLALMKDIIYVQLVNKGYSNSRFFGDAAKSLCNAPLGYMIEAVKPNRLSERLFD